jgi:hypothetical protein
VSTAVNAAWGVERQRSFVRHKLFSFFMLAAAGGMLLLSVMIVSAAQIVDTTWFLAIDLESPLVGMLTGLGSQAAATLLMVLVCGMIFYFVPNARVRFLDVWPGASRYRLCWNKLRCRASHGSFSDMSRFTVHGSIAAVVVFLLWIYVSARDPAVRRGAHCGVRGFAGGARKRLPATPAPRVIPGEENRRTAHDARGPVGRRSHAGHCVESVSNECATMPNRACRREEPVSAAARPQPGGWYPWGEAGLRTRAYGGQADLPLNRLLDLSLVPCDGARVVRRRSMAEVLNSHFVPVKVDREERPDIDRIYMTFVQASTGSGGWPMSVWLTPDLKPFYGGTYFPPSSRWGRPGFVELLKEIARVWREERAQVISSAEASLDGLRRLARRPAGGAVAGVEALVAGVEAYRRTFDRRHGGFGSAPKFPRPSELLFLMREHARGGGADAADMALATLDAMARGGIRDHLGGGFHRYSVDGQWRVPHFEKMLYDQAQLVTAFLEAAQLSGKAFYAGVAEDTLHYVSRDLGDPAGGFFSAEDADSVPPEEVGINGAAKPSEAPSTCGKIARDREAAWRVDAELFKMRYGVEAGWQRARTIPMASSEGRNLLYFARSIEEAARAGGRHAEEVREVSRTRTAGPC